MGKEEWLEQAERYIADCQAAATAPRLGEFASRMNLSPVQLERAFRASVGANVGAFFKRRQLEHVQLLLTTTNLSTAAIASVTGFGTPRTFFRAFRRATGTTPTRFRREKNVPSQA